MNTFPGTHPLQSLHAFIICWTGKEEASRHIAEAILPCVDHLTVIYSNATDSDQDGAGNWIKVPDDWFYGRKCAKCLELNKGSIMLHITPDVTTENWPQLVRQCRSVHTLYENTGIWAPDIDFTDWVLKTVKIGTIKNTQLALVTQTDSVVWSMSTPVIRRLQQLDYECNNFGWGIDWLAISFAMANNLLVVRDMSVKVIHPKSTGYCSRLAAGQMRAYLAQMTPQENMQYTLLRAFNSTSRPLRLTRKALVNSVMNLFKPASPVEELLVETH